METKLKDTASNPPSWIWALMKKALRNIKLFNMHHSPVNHTVND